MNSRVRLLLLVGVLVACRTQKEQLVHVMAKTAPGVKPGARVTLDGKSIGIVKQVYPTPNGVRIDVAVGQPDVKIGERDSVSIQSVGAFGEQVVVIDSRAALDSRTTKTP